MPRRAGAAAPTRRTQPRWWCSFAHLVEVVDVELAAGAEHLREQRQPHHDLGGGDDDDHEREHLTLLAVEEAAVAYEHDVDCVEHQLDAHEHDDGIATDQHAESTDAEQEGGEAEQEGEVVGRAHPTSTSMRSSSSSC